MADNLKRAKKDVAVFFDHLERLKEFVLTRLSTASIKELQLRLNDLISGFDKFNVSQSIIDYEDEVDTKKFKSRQIVEELYYNIRPQLEVQILKLEKAEPNPTPNPSRPTFVPKLPEIHLPSFSGDPLEWTNFYESFKTMIHQNDSLSDYLKFQYLRSSLRGSASEIIAALDLTDKNYRIACTLLKERFDNQKYICEEHIRAMFDIRRIEKPSSSKLLSMLDKFNSHIRSLKTLGRPVANWDDIIVHMFVSKLDSETTSKWIDHAPPTRLATFGELSDFIKLHSHKLDLQPKSKPMVSTQPKFNTQQLVPYHKHRNNTFLISSSRYKCTFCEKSGHSIYRCTKFLKQSVSERKKSVENLKLCFNCLRNDHFSSACPNSYSCRVCSKKHHSILHDDESSTSNVPKISTNSDPTTSSSSLQSTPATTVLISSSGSYVFLATAVVKFLDQYGKPILGRVLLDSGSQLNFATEAFCAKLGLKRSRSQSSVCGIGNSSVSPRFSSTVTLLSRINKFAATIDVQILPKIAQPQPAVPFNNEQWKMPTNIQLADPDFYKPQHIDVLLGAELFCELLIHGQIRISDDLPVLQNTVFGWIVSGKSSLISSSEKSCMFTCLQSIDDLDSKIEAFWKLESISDQSTGLSSEEQKCEDHFLQNTIRNDEGRFVVRLPFIQSPSTLGDSLSMAKRRFFNLEKRFIKNPDLRQSYSKFIAEYLQMGHMQKVHAGEIPSNNFYFPHHCVLKPESSTTKLRVVFDGSAKSTTGVSINDILMVGSVVQHDLFTILIRFRAHRYVFSADISKMYRQIQVHTDDTQYQLILWRDDPSEDLQTFKLTTVTYGTAAAPFLVTRCLRQLSSLFESSHPLGSSVVRDDTYVDDILTGSDSVDNLQKIKSEVVDILHSAGMELRKWYSNSSTILSDVPLENQETLLRLDEGDFVKTLGVHWQPLNDEFHININVSSSSNVTKRSVISDIARVFDPLGLSAPVITLGKLFMQKLWSLKVGWDDRLHENLVREWESFRTDLPKLRSVHIPRHLFNRSCPSDVELHGFSDASEKAYGAVIYTRCNLFNDSFHTSLLCAKSRVAPLNKITLPRLELCAAQLLAQLMHKVSSIVNFKVSKMFYWLDSTIVLHWIRAPSSSWKTFVANRVSNIQELTEVSSWYHVDSKNNPADVISRGLTPTNLLQSELWFQGPTFLSSSCSNWPSILPDLQDDGSERRKTMCVLASAPEDHYFFTQIDRKFHNSFWRMQRILAFVCRFVKNCRLKSPEKSNRHVDEPSPEELSTGLVAIVRAIQSISFGDEILVLQRGNPVQKNPLKSLSVFLDSDGILRVGGRIQQSTLPYSTKHPMILPKNHKFTLTIINFYHNRYLHAAPQSLLAGVREMFWPIDGRRLATKLYKNCRICAKTKPKGHQQFMGNLPAKRLEQSPPFPTVGIDFCGPLYVHYKIRGKSPTKVYICVFVCFVVKAIHLELVGDLSTSSFLGALKRFVAARGLCRHIYSDNGTNFVGANSSLHEVYKLFNSDDHIKQLNWWCEINQITWHFAPPGSPHFGGIYEAAVKSAKFHLRRIMGNANLIYEELLTVVKQVEAVLNSRPITPMSSNPDDLVALTPGHFLIGRPLMAVPECDYSTENINLLKRWELVTALVQHFWTRWRNEYLTSLQQRHKWATNSTNLKKDDMVIVKDENLPTNKWMIARFEEVHPGQDGRVRVATIKTSKGTLKRPIAKLCHLPTPTEEEN